MLSNSLLLSFLIDLAKGLSHDCDEHVEKNDSCKDRTYDEKTPNKNYILRYVKGIKGEVSKTHSVRVDDRLREWVEELSSFDFRIIIIWKNLETGSKTNNTQDEDKKEVLAISRNNNNSPDKMSWAIKDSHEVEESEIEHHIANCHEWSDHFILHIHKI